MDYRFLGNSGFKVPALGLGTGTFGGKGPLFSAWGRTDVEEATRFVDLCLWKFPVEAVLPRKVVPETAKWFFDVACKSKTLRAKCLKNFSGPFAKYLKARSQTPKKEQG